MGKAIWEKLCLLVEGFSVFRMAFKITLLLGGLGPNHAEFSLA